MDTSLPEGFTARRATLDDVPAIYRLLQSHERALYGYSDKFLAYVQATYSSPTLDLARDSCLIFDRVGQLAGSMLLEQSMYTNFAVTICVAPSEPDSYLDAYLLRLAESKARVLMAQAPYEKGIALRDGLPSWVRTSLLST
ncbi:hypothetical protein [Ktedonospora formicarum]|uniref:Uncharacterized protein n=1 Tax=Ktedonospora formicarum TaxID=2778364 RepID=A0A8J3MZR8_9CHLR|nr:hypothetical protein [Ktedonospora formicarum]GHO51065.1 hypothetical protein KSX_92280 [Ktedonospora formicarum]